MSAYQEFLRRITSGKYLYGTYCDRETGSTNPHRFRVSMGFHMPARKDNALVTTVGSDGEDRRSLWIGHDLRNLGKGMAHFEKLADTLKSGTWEPPPLKVTRFPKPAPSTGFREIAVPTVEHRLLASELLDVLEPVLDQALSPHQHGYRSGTVPGFMTVSAGSTEIVARLLMRYIKRGYVRAAEIDARNAFQSVNRQLLREMLVHDGCPNSFADLIIESPLGIDCREARGERTWAFVGHSPALIGEETARTPRARRLRALRGVDETGGWADRSVSPSAVGELSRRGYAPGITLPVLAPRGPASGRGGLAGPRRRSRLGHAAARRSDAAG
jgi:hypothetical protein